MQLFLVALGGALGAMVRYLVTAWVQQRLDSFPWGTLVVNLVGSFLIGMVLELTIRGFLTSQARLFLAVGILGGFTTFSSLSWETLALLEDGDVLPALAYAGGSLVAGVVLAWLGAVTVRWLWSL